MNGRFAAALLALFGAIAPVAATVPRSRSGDAVGVGSPRSDVAAARGALTRLFGAAATRRFSLALRGDDGAWYEVGATGGQASVVAGSPAALVRGAYAYLNAAGAASVSWEGNRVALPARLPDAATARVSTPFNHRVYLNTCTFGYTTPYWNWPRWEREIDWMAAEGIDMPLALEGQEYVWRALWRENGLSKDEIAGYFAGPAFLPWQRMGNIEGYRASLPDSWIERKHSLQLRILGRMRALGMKPVLPAFAGYVPKAFADRHPEARIYRMRSWEGFAGTYWLDPADPLFARLASRFLALYRTTYGAGGYYLADAFNEMVPPIAEDGSDIRNASYGDATANAASIAKRAAAVPAADRDRRLAAYGERLYRSITDANPNAVWVMQGWLFGADKAFWTPPAIKAFLSRVPNNRMLLLDIGNDRYPGIWKTSNAFDGKRWIYGYVHNYGGSNPVYGDLDFYRSDLAALSTDEGNGRLDGFGMFPEGLHSNSIVYAYAYDLAWGAGSTSTAAWLARHLRARYGQTTPGLLEGWRDVVAGSYRTRYWTPRWWQERAGAYLLFKRPTAGIVAFEGAPGDRALLTRGIDRLLAEAAAVGHEPLFQADLVDLVRHSASLHVDHLLQTAVVAYRQGNIADGDAAVAELRTVVLRIDRLIGGQHETLASWVDQARRQGGTAAERTYHARNALAQVTVWGGEGHLSDYASKAWSGLYVGYYLPRWTMLLDAMRRAAVTHRAFDELATLAAIRKWEQAYVTRADVPAATAPRDAVAAARALAASTRP